MLLGYLADVAVSFYLVLKILIPHQRQRNLALFLLQLILRDFVIDSIRIILQRRQISSSQRFTVFFGVRGLVSSVDGAGAWSRGGEVWILTRAAVDTAPGG